MLRFGCSIVLLWVCSTAISQTTSSDEALLAKTRALYDAPFSRGLISFDCAVQFDWKKHFIDLFGTVPPAAVPTVERLAAVQHRVFIDRSGATVSAIPKAPDLTGVVHGTELEQGLQTMVSGGLNGGCPLVRTSFFLQARRNSTLKRSTLVTSL